MTGGLLRLVRWIAGRDRAEWAEAMAAETEAAGAEALGWAWGCVAAALIDRIRGSARTILAVILLPMAAFALQSLMFIPEVWLSQAFDLPRWALLTFTIFTPLPVAVLLGWLSSPRGALASAFVAFFVFYAVSMFQWWIAFGDGPSIFFDRHMQIHHLHAQLGMLVDLGVWLLGSLISTRLRRTWQS
jgi:hypothetical protein